MAGASMNDIKARIKSVNSTMQITKAMELVATSKLRRAKEKVENSRPFHRALLETISTLAKGSEAKSLPYLEKRETKNTLYVVIAGDRGLAGGYNANIFRHTAQLTGEGEAVYLPVGKKSLEYYKHRDARIYSEEYADVSELGVGECLSLAQTICEGYISGAFDRVEVVYTKFASMISHIPSNITLLPVESTDGNTSKEKSPDIIFGGEIEEIIEKTVPQYVGGILYSAVLEARASESGARRMAMNSANKNAEEMIGSLMLGYNRARQAVITQEITEIVSGAEAL